MSSGRCRDGRGRGSNECALESPSRCIASAAGRCCSYPVDLLLKDAGADTSGGSRVTRKSWTPLRPCLGDSVEYAIQERPAGRNRRRPGLLLPGADRGQNRLLVIVIGGDTPLVTAESARTAL